LVEHWSPKPGVGSSSLSTRANKIIMAGIVNYISESYNELKNHVTWPSYAEAQRLTVIVLVFSVLFSLAIWGVDTVFSSAIEQYFEWVKS
jgi:preprotein translocase subunit SecE